MHSTLPRIVPAAPEAALEAVVTRKLLRRMVPFLFFSFVAAYIDRTNVGFAALTMNKSLGFDSSVYGMGAGIFAVGYFIFGVPSNLMLERLGSRVWLGTIMIVWAAVSASTAFVKTTPQFYWVRFFLGSAEAGLGPGLVLYITYWAPTRIRARLLSLASIASLCTAMFTAPLSTWILTTWKMSAD